MSQQTKTPKHMKSSNPIKNNSQDENLEEFKSTL